MATYFVDASSGNDANDGLDNIGVGLATATWTEATFTLTQNGHGYTFAAGDVINVLAGTGVAQTGLYEVESSTANNIVLVETSTLPGIQNASDFAAGNLATGDITSSDGPFLTIEASEDVPIAAGDHVWIRGGTTYNEVVTLDVAGTSDTALITWRGYTTTLDDNGRFKMDGQGVRQYCVYGATARDYRMWINMELTDSTTSLVLGQAAATDYHVFRNCYFHDAVAGITDVNDFIFCERCIFENLTGAACWGNISTTCTGCVFKNCSSTVIVRGESVFVLDCLFYDVGVSSVAITADFTGVNIIVGCTMYGSKDTADVAIQLSAVGHLQAIIYNNIITHWTVGIDLQDDWTNEWCIGYNNVLYDNGSDYEVNSGGTSGKFTHTGEVTANPTLVNPGGDDYSIPGSGGAYGAGLTGFDTDGADSNRSIGAFSPSSAGGLITHPGTSGGARG